MYMCIYRRQTAKVLWNGHYSSEFPIRNGVRQGAVISPLFFSFYMDNLFDVLRTSGSGCYVDRYYAGCFGYADDLFLLCPSRKGLQSMLHLAEKYVLEHSISFSTNADVLKSKSKGIIFSRKPLNFEPAQLILDSNPLPWVKQAKYLGNELENIPCGLSKDARVKRAKYIEKNIELNQEFPYAHPDLKCKINRIYNSAFPGSVLYDLTSESVNMLVNSWSVSVRHMWTLPFNAHRYLMEPLAGDHAFTMILSRFVKFLQNIRKSSKMSVQYMLSRVMENVSTVTGKNVRYVKDLIGIDCDLLKTSQKWLKKKLSFCVISPHDQWRVDIIREIADINQDVLCLQTRDHEKFLSRDELMDIVHFASSS